MCMKLWSLFIVPRGCVILVCEKMRRENRRSICLSLSFNVYHYRFKKRKGKWKHCSIWNVCRLLRIPRIWLFTQQFRRLAVQMPPDPWDSTVITVILLLCGIHSFLLHCNTPIVSKLESDGRVFVTEKIIRSSALPDDYWSRQSEICVALWRLIRW
jgi:hypothetical protein